MQKLKFNSKSGLLVGGSVVGLALISQPVNAQTSPVSQVEDTVNSVGTIAGTAASIVVVALGVRLAIKQVNRIMTKG